MDNMGLSQNPFAVVTFIAAPALLTNSSSVLAMSTINRFLRTRDRMSQLLDKSKQPNLSDLESTQLLRQVGRVERQASLLLQALRGIYIALGSFAGATLVTLLGAVLQTVPGPSLFHFFASLGVLLGCCGVGGLIFGSVQLFHATQISLVNIGEEAELIRQNQAARNTS